MSSLPQVGHEHHARIREHVDRWPALADMLEEPPVPDAFAPAYTEELAFMRGTLWPHVEVVEANVYPELERLQQNRHSMAHLRREHEELAQLIGTVGSFADRVAKAGLTGPDALDLRRALLSLYALVKTHLGEEAAYLRVLEGNLSDTEQAEVERSMEHASTT
jgi:hypothetical protein